MEVSWNWGTNGTLQWFKNDRVKQNRSQAFAQTQCQTQQDVI